VNSHILNLMAPRSAFAVVLIWGLVGSTDAAQVARDKNSRPKQALRTKNIPVQDQNTLLDDTLLSALTPFDSSKGKPGDNHQIKNLLRLASGTDRLDPDAFDALFESLRTSTKTNLNTSVEGIESDYNGRVAGITACETNHGFHGVPANARRIAYDAAVQSSEDATQVAEQKCSTQTSNCNDQQTKAMALHNYVQTEIVNTYGCTQASVQCPPTVFGPTDFYLRDTDDVAAAVKEKHGAWETAAGKCSAATGECNAANENTNDKCEDVDGVAVNGRSDYDQCYGQHQGILNGFQLDTLIANQKTVVRQLEKVLCIIKVAVDSHGDTPKRDSVMTCTDLGVDLSPTGGAIEYKCVCTSPSSTPPEIYSETYVTQLTLDPEPSRDTAWDALGCANSVISTTVPPAAPWSCPLSTITDGQVNAFCPGTKNVPNIQSYQACKAACSTTSGCTSGGFDLAAGGCHLNGIDGSTAETCVPAHNPHAAGDPNRESKTFFCN